jgi:hypothetical protein
MELCSSGHDEICFLCRNCPLCEAIQEKRDVQHQLDEVVLDYEEMRDQRNGLRDEIKEFKGEKDMIRGI